MNAYLLLANGMVFAGQSVGAEGVTVGEVVFATGMVGFQETLTDPSYYGQIITQTYPLIGNYGMNKDDMESDKIWARGYIVREACQTPSNWRCEETLDSFLKKNNTIGIEGIDTRHLTRIIRESGVMNGAILTTFDPADPANKAETDKLLEEIRAYAVTDAVKSVTCAEPEVYNEKGETHIVLMHYGCKRNIIRCLVKRGCKVTVMPAFATAEEVAALDPDGIMLSNGPGDPAEPVEVIENLKHIFELNIPTFGICLGHQLSALAAGAKTMKLKYGHIRPEPTVAHFHGAAGNRVLAQLARATGMVVGQIMSHFDSQLVRRDGVRQGGTLRVAFGIQMLHIFQIRAVPANAHMQAVADVNGVDGSGVDLAKLGHLLLQAFMRFVGIAGRALAGAEVEVGQPIPASLLAVSNAIEAVFHLSGERVIDQLGEVRFQQLGHGECQPAGDQRTATLIHIAAIHNRGDDAGIGGRAADLLGFQRLDRAEEDQA